MKSLYEKMNEIFELLKRENRDWDKIYSSYDSEKIPWHSDEPDKELTRLIESQKVKPSRVLDVGCGIGTDAIYLALRGSNVTAIDVSNEAIRLARERAEKMGAKVDFKVANILDVEFQEEGFDFINDRGCFHHINPSDRGDFGREVNRMLEPNGYYYLRCWSDRENEREEGPYTISKREIKETFSKYFTLGAIKSFRFGGEGALGYSCLMKKEV